MTKDKKADESKNNQLAVIHSPEMYRYLNIVFNTGLISTAVSVFQQPIRHSLNNIQMGFRGAVYESLFRNLYRGFPLNNLYRGFPLNFWAGQKSGALSVTHKQTHAGKEEKEEDFRDQKSRLGTFLFSQIDLGLSSASSHKAKLINVGIINNENYKRSFTNWRNLTAVTWGSRSCAGFINFSFLGEAGDYFCSFYEGKFGSGLMSKIFGGATSGAAAAVLTTPFHSYGDRKLLKSTMENGKISTVNTFTMFRDTKSYVKEVGISESLLYSLKMGVKEMSRRCSMSVIAYTTIFVLEDYLKWKQPLKVFYQPSAQPVDSEQKSTAPVKPS